MMRIAKIFFAVLIFLSTIATAIPLCEDISSDSSKPSIRRVYVNNRAPALYGLVEFTLDLSGSYTNPFDPEQIEVLGRFTSPSGREIAAPAFYYQNFSRTEEKTAEQLKKEGKPVWKIRFTPLETGAYTCYVEVRNKGKTVKLDAGKFNVSPSGEAGFIRVDKNSLYYMKFDSGKPYFAVGESIAWVKRHRRTYDYDYYFTKLAENDCNYSRLWIVEWNIPLEWMPHENTNGTVHGLGKYSMDNSWRLDYILDLAKKKGIYLLITLDTYGSIMAEKGYWREERWSLNPYNVKNGGPCATPDDFWTNEEAKKLYKRKLRYIISRWGYSSHVLAFELWNEMNAPKEWVKEMAGYIKENDPYGHMVTTSVGYPFDKKHLYNESEIWELKEIDYTQNHLYGYHGNIKDVAKAVSAKCLQMTEKYRKPCLLAEFGLDFGSDDIRYDRSGEGTHLRNALWASVMSRAFGTAMTHWKEYVDKKNLYYLFKAVSNFVKDIEWIDGRWEMAKVDGLKLGSYTKQYSDFVIACEGDWGETGGEEITIRREGVVEGKINQFVHGMLKKDDLRFMPIFYVDYPGNGKLILEVDSVAQGADITVYIDGKSVWKHSFLPGPGKGEWKSCKLDNKYDIYIARYDKKYEIDVPAGKHDIRIENTGKDWLRLRSITLTRYRDESVPFVRVLGLSREGEAILWIQNRESNWNNIYMKKNEIKPVDNFSFNLLGLSDGEYSIEWWDTSLGKVMLRKKAICRNGRLPITPPEIYTDIACKIADYSKK